MITWTTGKEAEYHLEKLAMQAIGKGTQTRNGGLTLAITTAIIMRMHPADQQKALNNQHSGETLRKCIARLNQQWQSGLVQFRHQLHTGELELDEEFYECWSEAEAEREQFYADWEEADTEREIERRDQEYRDHWQRPPNDKEGDRRMHLPEKRSDK